MIYTKINKHNILCHLDKKLKNNNKPANKGRLKYHDKVFQVLNISLIINLNILKTT